MSTNWFAEYLQEEGKKRRLNVTAMAVLVDVNRETFDKWHSGAAKPKVLQAFEVLGKLGWKMDRARPDWRPEPNSSILMRVHGQVAAGAVTTGGEFEHEIPAVPDSWRNSKLWGLTHGEVVLLEIYGDSMSPRYNHGQYIACRAPNDPREIPDGTACILRDPDGLTFKLLYRDKKGGAVGMAINQTHPPVIFRSPEELRMDYVVLGLLDTGAERLDPKFQTARAPRRKS